MSDPRGTHADPPRGRLLLVRVVVGAGMLAILGLAIPHVSRDPLPGLVPQPLEMESTRGLLFNRGSVRIDRESRFIVRNPALREITRGLDETLWMLTDLDLGVVTTSTYIEVPDGDIVLALDPELDQEEYRLEVGDHVRLEGGTPEAVAWAVASLVQLGTYEAGRAILPRVRIRDRPRFPYRALMVDVAARPHAVEELRELVTTAQLYKVRYLHLHLTDDQAFTFPVSALDLGRPWRSYRREELEALESYAATRGVVLVPEIHLPGRARALVDARPEVFALADRGANPRTIHMAREEAYQAVDSIIGDVARVFPRAPFIHVGGGPVSLRGFRDDEETRLFMEANGIPDVGALPGYFGARVADMVRRRGKRPLIWDGGATDDGVLPDAVILARGSAARDPRSLLDQGATLVNASPRPLDVSWGRRASREEVADWIPSRWDHWDPTAPSHGGVQVPDTAGILGGHVAVWDQDGFLTLPGLRTRLPVVAETLWRGDGAANGDRARFARVNQLVMRMLRPARMRVRGTLDPGYDGPDINRRDWFADTLTVEAAPWIPGDRILATLDGSEPDPSSDRFNRTLRLWESRPVRFRVVDREGRQRGFSWLRYFERRPIEARLARPAYEGAPGAPDHVFVDSARVVLRRLSSGGEIRYTLDGEEPAADDSVYRGPIALTGTTTLRARVFDHRGKPHGDLLDQRWVRVTSRDHLAADRFVETHGGDPWAGAAPLAVDGLLDRDRFWVADPAAGNAWIQVDLGRASRLGGLLVVGSWDGVTAYRYRASGSRDGRTWVPLADRSTNEAVATEEGYEDSLEGPVVRWVRLEAVAGPDVEPLRLVELAVIPVPAVRADGS